MYFLVVRIDLSIMSKVLEEKSKKPVSESKEKNLKMFSCVELFINCSNNWN